MTIWMNILMTTFATAALTFGISYFVREKTIGRLRYYILWLGILCACANLGYMMMSVMDVSFATLIFRNLGLLGVNGYLYTELLLILDQVDIEKYIKRIIRIVVGILGVVTMLIHGWEGDVTFERVDNFTVFVNNYRIGYYLQVALTIAFFIVLLSVAIVWVIQQKSKRARSFIALCFISNFMYVFSSGPYFFGMKTDHPAFLYCLGTMVAYFVIWYAGMRFCGFQVTTQSLSSDIFSIIDVGLLVFDEKAQLIMNNEYIRIKFGIDKPNGELLSDIFEISSDKAEAIMRERLSANTKNQDYKFTRKGRSYSVSFSLKRDIFKDPLCIIAVVSDITKEERMIAQVISANEAKSDFLASMSHEIRTPINAVLGMNEMIIRESNQKDVIEYAKDVESSGRMLLSLINDILDFSKVESGKMELNPVNYDVSSFVNDIYNMLIFKANDKGLEFKVNVDKNVPCVLLGDEIRVRQIVINLLTNAIKYTEKGYVKLDISGEKLENEEYSLSFAVSDTGKGIKEEDQVRLFDSFTRVDEVENRSIEGTGLGLALTKNFTKAMGGDVTLVSEYGKGSTFTATILQGIVDATAIGDFNARIESHRSEENTDRSTIYAPKAQLLVVDDVEMNCKVFCGLLKKSGIAIDTALSGMEALDRCKNKRYDIVFMDHRMPNMDGVECLRELRKLDTPNNDTPVIILTANAIAGMKEMYMQEGFAAFLSKPIDYKNLEKAIKQFIPHLLEDKQIDNKPIEDKKVEVNKDMTPIEIIKTQIPEIDVATGLSYCMDDEEFYIEIVGEYVKGNRCEELERFYAAKDYDSFRTSVHAVKSTSLNIGATSLSERAKALELAAADKDAAYIEANFEEFSKDYKAFVDKLTMLA